MELRSSTCAALQSLGNLNYGELLRTWLLEGRAANSKISLKETKALKADNQFLHLDKRKRNPLIVSNPDRRHQKVAIVHERI